MMSAAKKNQLSNDDDDGDDNDDVWDDDDDEEADVSLETTSVSHGKKGNAAGSVPSAFRFDENCFEPAALKAVEEIEPLRKRRKESGYYGDDGLAVDRGKKTDDPLVPFNEKYIRRLIENHISLEKSAYFRFIRRMAGRAGIESLIEEGDSRELEDRIRRIRAAIVQQQQRAQDTSGEQKRVNDAAADANKAKQAFLDAKQQYRLFRFAGQQLVRTYEEVSLKQKGVDLSADGDEKNAAFDLWTRSGVALYGLAGYRKTLAEATAVCQNMQKNLLDLPRNGAPKERVARLKSAMPLTTEAALCLAALLIVTQNALLLERVAQARQSPFSTTQDASSSSYTGQNYADDLVTLATLLFDDNAAADAHANPLFLDKINALLWAHINKMLQSSNSASPPLQRPQKKVAEVRQRSSKIVASGIEVEFEISDEDLARAASNHELDGVSQEQIENARRTFYENVDQVRTMSIWKELLQPMLRTCFPALFYQDDLRIDVARDWRAFAGGYDETANATHVAGGKHLAAIALLLLSNRVVLASIDDSIVRRSDIVAYLDEPIQNRELFNNVAAVFKLSNEVNSRYNARVTQHWLRSLGAVEQFAQYVVTGSQLELVRGFTATQVKTLAALIEVSGEFESGTSAPTGVDAVDRERAARLSRFADAEKAAAAIFVAGSPTTAEPDAAAAGLEAIKNLDALTPNQRGLYKEAKEIANKDRFKKSQKKRKEDAEKLQEIADQLQKRYKSALDKSERGIQEQVAEILRGEFVATAKVALSPANSGIVVPKAFVLSAIETAYSLLFTQVPCVYDAYTDDDLIESDLYSVMFSQLARLQIAGGDVLEQAIPLLDKTSIRVRTAELSIIKQIRVAAKTDTSIKHRVGETVRPCICNSGNWFATLASQSPFAAIVPDSRYFAADDRRNLRGL